MKLHRSLLALATALVLAALPASAAPIQCSPQARAAAVASSTEDMPRYAGSSIRSVN